MLWATHCNCFTLGQPFWLKLCAPTWQTDGEWGASVDARGHAAQADAASCRREAAAIPTHLIGGSKLAGELDAKRAIREGFQVAASI